MTPPHTRGCPAAFVLVVLAIATFVAACGGSEADRGADQSQQEVRLGEPSTSTPETAMTETTAPREARPAAKKPSRPASRPPIKQWPIPFPAMRQRETEAYTQRHYGVATAQLDPQVIVEHYTVTPTAQATFDIFAQDKPDVELKELPGLCSHFIVDRDGTIFQLVPLAKICRHTVGLNDVAIGIEHVGGSDQDVLGDRAQLASSLKLTAWLRCRFGIEVSDVIGHAESLSSPRHHERVAALKTQTHQDFQRGAMDAYRAKLRSRSC